jgi:hypothetical protein
MGLRSIHNAKLRWGGYTWHFQVCGQQVLITQIAATNGRRETVGIEDRLLPAFISHLGRALQELREARKKAKADLSVQELIRSL